MISRWRLIGAALLAVPITGAATASAGAADPAAVVAAPTDAHLEQSGSSVVVTWGASSSDAAGSTVTAWIDDPAADSCTADASATTCTIELSEATVPHEVFIQVMGPDGVTTSAVVDLGPTEALVTVDPSPLPAPAPDPIVDPIVDPVPGPPLEIDGLTATAEDGGVVITWTPTSAPGQVYGSAASDDGASWGWCWADASTGTCEITGLVDGFAHDVWVITMNADGWILSDSTDLGSVTPEVNEGAVAPSPPTLTDLSSDGWGGVIPVDVGVIEPRLDSPRPVSWSGWADLTAMFDAPASDGGSPVRSVDVTATDIDTGEQLSCSTIPSASSCTLGGVRPGETYVVTATATNGAGTSAPSDPSSITIPVDPTDVRIADVTVAQDPATGAWWTTLTLDEPMATSTSLEVVDDQGDACVVTLAEGDLSGSCQIADPEADEPTGLTVLPLRIFPIAYDEGVPPTGSASGERSLRGGPTPADATPTGTSAAPLAFAPASDVPAFPVPAAAAVEPAASSEPGPSTARVALASSHVADRVASSSSGGSMLLVGVLGLLLTVSLLAARVRRPRT